MPYMYVKGSPAGTQRLLLEPTCLVSVCVSMTIFRYQKRVQGCPISGRDEKRTLNGNHT